MLKAQFSSLIGLACEGPQLLLLLSFMNSEAFPTMNGKNCLRICLGDTQPDTQWVFPEQSREGERIC